MWVDSHAPKGREGLIGLCFYALTVVFPPIAKIKIFPLGDVKVFWYHTEQNKHFSQCYEHFVSC